MEFSGFDYKALASLQISVLSFYPEYNGTPYAIKDFTSISVLVQRCLASFWQNDMADIPDASQNIVRNKDFLLEGGVVAYRGIGRVAETE